MKPFRVKIDARGTTQRVEVDGIDLSNRIAEATVYLSAMHVPRVVLELIPDTVEVTSWGDLELSPITVSPEFLRKMQQIGTHDE